MSTGGLVDPRADDFLFHEARSLHSDGRWDEAEAKYKQFIEQNPRHVAAHNNYARGLMRLGRTDDAIEEFEIVIALDPTKYSAYKWLAECYRKVGRDEDAERATLNHEAGRASALHAAGRWAEAEPVYLAVLEADPDHGLANYQYGYSLMSVERPQDAIKHLRAAIAADPSWNDVHQMLAQCYRATGDEAAAEAEMREYLFGQAWELQSSGRWAEAERLYASLLRQHPEHVQARFNYAHGLMEAGRHEEAIPEFVIVLEREPKRHAAHNWLAVCYRAVGDETSAERHAALYEATRERGG